VQLTHRSIDPQGPAQRFRFDAHCFRTNSARSGSASRFKLRTPEAAFDEIRQTFRATACRTPICWRAAELNTASPAATEPSYDVPGPIFSSQRLFVYQRHTGPLLFQAHFAKEAKDAPWSSAMNAIASTSPGGIASQDRVPAVCADDGWRT
jgi:hypothetical protein